MKRAFSILSVVSLAFVMMAANLAQAPSALQPDPEHLNRHQLKTLIATAKTPEEHRRIAQFYQSMTQKYLAQSEKHEEMLKGYQENKYYRRASFINHCQYEVQRFTDKAAKSQKLVLLHEQMARDAEQK